MTERKRITHQFMQAVGSDPLLRVIIPALLILGIFWAGWQVLRGDWLQFALSVISVALLVVLTAVEPVQRRVLRQPFNRQHAVSIGMAWVFGALWLITLRLLIRSPIWGKDSEETYFAFILLIAFTWMFLRPLLMLLPFFYKRFVTAIPLWEQVLLAINEVIAAGLLATFGANAVVHAIQPETFTTRFDLTYNLGLGVVIGIYYFGMQAMWTQRWNDWISRSAVWIRLARLVAPLVLVVTTMVIVRHFIDRADPARLGWWAVPASTSRSSRSRR